MLSKDKPEALVNVSTISVHMTWDNKRRYHSEPAVRDVSLSEASVPGVFPSLIYRSPHSPSNVQLTFAFIALM